MTDVIAGKTGKDSLSVLDDNTQVYGLAGNDTLKSNGKNNVLLIGGSGDDRLIMTGGNGTLSGGKGKDVFELNYSAEKKISAVIEDIDPTNDKIVVTFDGSSTPELASVKSGKDVIWTDSDGYFNLTLKGSSDASDYFDGTASSEIWDVLRLTNDEREKEGLPWLTLSQGLAAGAAIRSTEIVDKFSHTRPDNTDCFTAVTKSYWSMGENIAAGQTSPEKVVEGWMNSPGHRANILNSDFKKLGVGYTYDASSDYKYHWVQMFGGGLTSPDTLSAEKILSTTMTLQKGSLPEDDATINTVIDADNTTITRGGTYTIAKNFTGTIRINTTDAVTIDGTSAGSLKNVDITTNVANADLTIKNLTVTNETGSAITFGTGTGNKLTLAGKNVLKTSDTWAAVVKIGGGLSIDGTGSLDVTAGSQGSGIGFDSYDCSTANITINGGTIKATTEKGAGIGSGCNGSIGNITINGGTIKTTSGTGAGIGSGMDGSSEKISIGGNAKVTATSEYGAGVGKGCNFDGKTSTVGKVTLSGKSSVLITQMNRTTRANFYRPTEFTINGKTYTDQQLSFENGAKKNLTERIIVNETVRNGTDSADNIFLINGSWYGAATIDAGKGNDSINAAGGTNLLILAGEGNDSIESMGLGFSGPVVAGYITLDAGTGNDTIWIGRNMGEIDDYYSSISGGAGDDSIQVNGNYVTINGGKGNDNIGFDGEYAVFEYNSGDGNDTIKLFNSTSSLSVAGGTFFTLANGSDVIVKVGTSSITFKDAKDRTLNILGEKNNFPSIIGTKANDTLENKDDNPRIIAYDGDDIIENTGSNATIEAGKGNDTISNGYYWNSSVGSNVSISGGDGNDSIYNYGDSVSINAGDGNDSVTNYGASISIDVGAGDDDVYSSGDNSTIIGGKGNDSVYNRGDSVSIDAGAGDDSVCNHGSSVSIDGGDGDDYVYSSGDTVTIVGSTGNDYILNSGDKVLFKYNVGDGNDTIVDGFNSKNTIQIFGDSYSTTASGNDVIIKVGKGSITLKDAAYKTLNIQTIAGGGSTDTTPADTTTLTVTNSTKSPVTIGSAVKNVDASKRTTAVKITGNDLTNSIVGGSKNDSLYGGAGADTLRGGSGNDKIFGEVGNDLLSGGAGNDTLTGGDGNDIFIYSAGKDVIADYATGDKISLGAAISKSSVKGSDVIFTIGSGSLTVKDGKGKTLNLIDSAGKESSTIFGGSDNSTLMTVTNSTKSPVTIGSAVKTVDASKRTTAVKITGNDAANSIVGGSKNDSLYGGKGNDSILGNAGNDKLYGETGNDLLYGGTGNDTLTGGDGNDIFIYSAGKDVIADYATGDKISLGAAISKSSVKGSDVIFTIGSGSLTVKNGKGKTLNLIDKSGKESSTILGDSDNSTLMTVTNSTKSPVTIGSAVKTVDASTRTKAVKITGNDLANSIVGGSKNDSLYGGKGNDSILGNAGNDKIFGEDGNDKLYGGAGNDSLWGGAGNDSLWGDAGADTFIYSNGDGKDVIFGFNDTDMLEITGAFSTSTNTKGTEIYFKVGSTAKAITLKDFGDTTTFNVNGDTYQLSGKTFVKK